MGFHLLAYSLRQTVFGQVGKRRVEREGHHAAVDENDERKDQVKFLWGHDVFSEAFSHVVTGRSSNFRKIAFGTGFDVCFPEAKFC